MALNNSDLSRIEVTAAHPAIGYIYALFTPTITIDGIRHRRPWGTHSFDVSAGDHEVSVSYPWLFSSECGKSTVQVAVQLGETKKVVYRVGLIRYLPGKMTVE